MAAIMGYCLVVATLVSVFALLVERLTIWCAAPRRLVWMVALAVSFLLPGARMGLVMFTDPMRVQPVGASPITRMYSAPEATRAVGAKASEHAESEVTPSPPTRDVHTSPRSSWPVLADWNRPLEWIWLSSSVAISAFYVIGLIRLQGRRRDWSTETVGGIEVCVSEGTGPAVIGCWNPKIVLPRWLLSAAVAERTMALRHECEHIRARDPLVLRCACILVVLAPWNLPLWWQLQRLRFAIEVDCDRRVLNGGADSIAYGEMLLSVAQGNRQSRTGALALTEKTSQLERRIRVIVGAVHRHSTMGIAVLAALCISIAVFAQQLLPPRLDLTPTLRKTWPELPSNVLDKARAASRHRFPELFERRIEGGAVIYIEFSSDGLVRNAAKKEISLEQLPDAISAWDIAPPTDAENEDMAYFVLDDAPHGAWSDSRNPYRVVLIARALRWSIDATRSAARVKQAVSAYFPDQAALHPAGLAFISVLMNEDGTVNRAERKILAEGASARDEFDLAGVNAQSVGRFGRTDIEGSRIARSDIHFAWPRRDGEPPAVTEEEARAGWWLTPQELDAWKKLEAKASNVTVEDEAILSRYFADALTNGLPAKRELWALLGRDGTVQATGHWQVAGPSRSYHHLEEELAARFPGAKVSNMACCRNLVPTRVPDAHGGEVALTYECLMPTSPVRDVQNAPPPQNDVFIAGWVTAPRSSVLETEAPHEFSVPFVASANFGQPATSRLFFGTEILATRIDSDTIELKLRHQTLHEKNGLMRIKPGRTGRIPFA